MKDLLSNVGSGGGAAAAPAAGGAAAGGAAAAEETKEEAKEEGEFCFVLATRSKKTNKVPQRRRSPTRTWASVSSTKRIVNSTAAFFLFFCSSKTCMDLRRYLALTTGGMEAFDIRGPGS